MNDNLIFSRNWEDDSLLELKVEAQNEYVTIWQSCYIANGFLKEQATNISNFVKMAGQSYYIEFGELSGNYTPAFSMELKKVDDLAHIRAELNLENEDDGNRKHRCQLYIKTEQGMLLNFCQGLRAMSEGKCDKTELNKLS